MFDSLPRQSTILLRIAIAFAFLYPAIDSIREPLSWVDFFPPLMRTHMPDPILLYGWAAVEVVIALWILSGRRIFLPSLAAAVALCLIVLLNTVTFFIVFRDVSLALVAAHLAWGSYGRGRG